MLRGTVILDQWIFRVRFLRQDCDSFYKLWVGIDYPGVSFIFFLMSLWPAPPAYGIASVRYVYCAAEGNVSPISTRLSLPYTTREEIRLHSI